VGGSGVSVAASIVGSTVDGVSTELSPGDVVEGLKLQAKIEHNSKIGVIADRKAIILSSSFN
jgi:hypothetical protein